jgi:hypothetical protein
LARAAYRTKQFLQALFPSLGEAHLDRARAVLSEGEMRLFLSMEKRDQRHGVRVMERLIEQGEVDNELLAAALLHDCGKGWVAVWLRVIYVLRPRYVEGLAQREDPGRGRRPDLHEWSLTFSDGRTRPKPEYGQAYRLINHAGLGAQLAEQAGSSPATIRYISGRVAEHERDKISVLRAADDES